MRKTIKPLDISAFLVSITLETGKTLGDYMKQSGFDINNLLEFNYEIAEDEAYKNYLEDCKKCEPREIYKNTF